MQTISHWIAGQDVQGDGETLLVYDPSTGKAIACFQESSAAQVHQATTAAHQSFTSGIWADKPFQERQAILRRAAQAIRDNAQKLCDTQIAETGMTAFGVGIQIKGAASWFDYFADFLSQAGGHSFQQLNGATTLVDREPMGVCALFSPWNVPTTLTAIKLAPALAAGNSVVLKPSEETPMTTRLLVDLVQQAGLADGVLNLVNGRGSSTGAALAQDPLVDMISFTGGSLGGQAVGEAAAKRHIPCVMELGGKSASIIFDDADFEAALEGALLSAYASNGEACLAGSRLIVQEGIAERFIAAFVKRVQRLSVGDPRQEGVQIGPMINAKHRDRVLSFYESARSDGDQVLCGGSPSFESNGYFVEPGAIMVNSSQSKAHQSKVWQEEVFGPLVAIKTFKDEQEAIDLANDSRYGLAGYVWSNHGGKALRVAKRLRTGTVIINSSFMRELNAPFGGYKASGIGREGGLYSWYNVTQAKTTIIKYI